MNNDPSLQAYYLQQLGIDAWILRPQRTVTPVVVLGEALVGDSLILWTHMLRSIGLAARDISIGMDDIDGRLKRLNPRAILSFGPHQGFQRGVIHQMKGYPLVIIHDPLVILENLRLKKETYADLRLLSTVLHSSNE